jgi:hypothetical protein
MRTPIKWVVWLFIWSLTSAMTPVGRSSSLDLQVSPVVATACQDALLGTPNCRLLESERRQVDEGVAEYLYTLQVGNGEHDIIVLHRVVGEILPGVPLLLLRSVFLVHGDIWGFRGAFLPSVGSSAVARKQSFAIHLARQGLDVWGIDLRWVQVPATTTDFTFMRNWNLEMHAKDVSTGMAVARGVRSLGLGLVGGGPMPLLGWSRGAAVGYALLNAEMLVPPDRRHVSAFIPVDMAYSFGADAQAYRDSACQSYKTLSALQAGGLYVDVSGQSLQDLGAFANVAPARPSPILPSFTNRQAALFAGAATWCLQTLPTFNWYHFTGGVLSGSMPTALSWTNERFFFDTLEQASPFQSIGEQVETLALWCGSPKLPYNDRLSQVKVPVLYVGAAGGMGRYGHHSVSLLGSKDVTLYLVQRLPENARAQDFGHADLWLSSEAEKDVWPRISEWLARH